MAYRRFVLISHLRSGTHMVRTALDSHPEIVCQGEPFNANSRKLPYPLETSTEEVLKGWVFSPEQAPEVRVVGFVLQLYHPGSLKAFPYLRKNEGWNNIWKILSEDRELSVVFLRRENLLRRHLSQVLARRTGFWHSWKGEVVDGTTHLEERPQTKFIDTGRPQVPPVQLDLQSLLTDFEEIRELRARAQKLFSQHRSHHLVYEDVCSDVKRAFGELQRFLGVPENSLAPATRRLEERSLAEAITNYDEIKTGLTGTCWESFLHDILDQDWTQRA